MHHLFNNPRQLVIISIILRLDPVGSIFFFFKSKQRRFIKSQRVCNRVVGSTRRVSWVTSGFFFPCFFFNPAGFQPRVCRVPGRPVGPGRVSKLWLTRRAGSGFKTMIIMLQFNNPMQCWDCGYPLSSSLLWFYSYDSLL
jgi:hypothetical protein